MSAALAIATEIAGKSPVAVRLAKLAINTVEEMSLRDGYRFEQEMTASLSQYDDSKEAMRAFLERRKGSFTGR
jgi:enoyl-CoA hydratase/carnithine racemase